MHLLRKQPVSPYSDHYDHHYLDYYDCWNDPSSQGIPRHDDGHDRVDSCWPQAAYACHEQAYLGHLDN